MTDPNCNDSQPYVPPYTVGDDVGGDGLEASSSSSADDSVFVYDYEELSEMCGKVGLTAEMIDGVLVLLLAQHFAQGSELIYSEHLHDVYWTPDANTTRLRIVDADAYDVKTASLLPAIVYKNLGQVPQRLAIGDQFYHDSRQPDRQAYARAYTGQHRIMCMGRTAGQAGALATEVGQWLTEFTPWIISHLPFHDFQVRQREPAQQFSDVGDAVGVALGISYSYIWSWELIPAGPPLKAVTITKNHG